MLKRLLFLLFLPSFFFAAEPALKGIFFTGQQKDVVKDGRRDLKGVEILDLDVPGGSENLKKLGEAYLGKEASKETLLSLKKDIILYYREKKFPGVIVIVPLQYIGAGTVQILISENRMGKVVFKGNKWFPNKTFTKYIHAEEGDRIDEEELKNDFAWMNQNPFHHSDYAYVDSEIPGKVDLEVMTTDRFPIRFFTIGDNTGNPSTGNDRFTGGLTWGNAFGDDDLLTYQYVTSNFPSEYQSQTGSYTSFLPWQHTLFLFGNYSVLKPQISGFNSKLLTNQERLRYQIPIKPLYTTLEHIVTFGFDFKYTNSNLVDLSQTLAILAPSETVPVIQKLQVSQLVGAYHFEDRTKVNYFWLDFTGYWSPADWLAHQSNKDYAAARPGGQYKYAYLNFVAGDVFQLPKKFSIAGLFTIQRANHTLPPTELFTIGGYNTVRGYNEAEFASDNGLIANFELRMPTFSPLRYIWKNVHDQMIFLGFMDYGIGTNIHSTGTYDYGTQYAWSVGSGLRYMINPYLNFRADYGFKLHTMPSLTPEAADYRKGFGKWHLGLMLSY